MTRQLILILLISLTTSVIKGQFPSDSVAFVYFHKTSDTVMVIEKNFYNPAQTYYYNLTRIYYDSSGANPYYTKALKFKTINEVNALLDSLSKVNYLLGTNLSNNCLNSFTISNFRKTRSDKWGYYASYNIHDIRILNGDTAQNSTFKKHKYYFNYKEPKEKQLKKSFRQISFAWSSADNRMIYYLFQNEFVTFDDDGNEITTTMFTSDMKKNKN